MTSAVATRQKAKPKVSPVSRARAGRLRFAKEVLNIKLWEKQKEIYHSVFENPYTAVRSGFGTGKTFCAAATVIAFLGLCIPSTVVTLAPTWLQVKNILWREIRKIYAGAMVPIGGECLQTSLHLTPGWYAIGLSPKDTEPERIQGFHDENILIIFDEAPGISKELYDSAVGIMTTSNAHMLLIGNPGSPSGFFYEAFRSARWNKINISCFDSPNVKAGKVVFPGLVGKQWIEDRREEWGEDSPLWKTKVLGDFALEGLDTLISLNWVEAAIARSKEAVAEVPGKKKDKDRTIIGVDVARSVLTGDKTVIAAKRGNRIIAIRSFSYDDTMKVAGQAVLASREYGAEQINVDEIGLGAGVVDRLKELNKQKKLQAQVNGVNVAKPAANSEKFFNLRSELWWTLREWIETEAILPNNAKMINDLTAPRWAPNSKGQIRIEPKAETKRRLHRSPDTGDALMLCMAHGSKPAPGWVVGI